MKITGMFLASALALTIFSSAFLSQAQSEWPTKDQLADAILMKPDGSGDFPLTRWEKSDLQLWILGRSKGDLARADEISTAFGRLLRIAGIDLVTCTLTTGSGFELSPCDRRRTPDIVYIVSDEQDLDYNALYLQAFSSKIGLPSDLVNRFHAGAHSTFDKGLECHSELRFTNNSNGVGFQYTAAILVNGERASEFGICNTMLSYTALGVGPIKGRIGSLSHPPEFSDAGIAVLYSKLLPAGSARSKVEDIASQLGALP